MPFYKKSCIAIIYKDLRTGEQKIGPWVTAIGDYSTRILKSKSVADRRKIPLAVVKMKGIPVEGY